MSARLAILRWSARIVMKERRQHALVVALIAFGIMTAGVVAVSIVRLSDPAAQALQERGNAVAVAHITVLDPASAESVVALLTQAKAAYPEIELVSRTPETTERIVLVSQDPSGPLAEPWLELREGRWPTGPEEIALTTRAVERLEVIADARVNVGSTVAVGGVERLVVGLHEDPTRLRDAMGLVAPSELDASGEILVLLPTEDTPAPAPLDELNRAGSGDEFPTVVVGYNSVTSSGMVLAAYLIGTVLCMQIAVLASAGFTVLANRRTRQLGVLSALGATPNQIGSVMTSTGLVVGLVGTALGLALAVVVSIALTPLLQPLVPYRLGATDLPWGYLLPMVPLGIATAVAGAWWPARRIRSTSAAAAIANRRGRSEGFVKSLITGVALLAAGGISMKIGAPKNAPFPIVAGVLAAVTGGLLLAPAAAALLGSIATAGPLALRVAWRDLSRNRGRTAAAVAAAAIAIGLPFGIASFAASVSHTWQPWVPENVAQVHPSWADGGERGDAEVAGVAARVPGVAIVAVRMAVDHSFDEPSGGSFETIPYALQTRRGNDSYLGLRTAVATPELLELMAIPAPGPEVDVIVTVASPIDLDPSIVVKRDTRIQPEGYPEALLFHDLPGISIDDTTIDSWYLVNDTPFTQRERDLLTGPTSDGSVDVFSGGWASQGTHVGLSDDPPPFVAIRSIALAVGAIFGLAAVAAAVALVRVEAGGEARILTAVGAGPHTSRSIGAATVWGLTLAAGLIAVPTVLVVLSGVYLNPDETFDFVLPWAELGTVFVLVPVVGAAAGWIFTSTRVDGVPAQAAS